MKDWRSRHGKPNPTSQFANGARIRPALVTVATAYSVRTESGHRHFTPGEIISRRLAHTYGVPVVELPEMEIFQPETKGLMP